MFKTIEFREILNLLVSVLSVAISAIVSVFVARSTASHEIKKMHISYDREDLTALRQTFSKLISSIDNYVDFSSGQRKTELRQAISDMIAISPGEVASVLSNVNLENKTHIVEIKKALISEYSRLLLQQEKSNHENWQ